MMILDLIVVICSFAFHFSLVNAEAVVESVPILEEQQFTTSNRRFPWMSYGFKYPTGVLQLHIEIDQFYRYMQQTSIERALRIRVATRVNHIVQQVWPDAQAVLFGSFTSNLSLPNSDIDLMILGASGQTPLQLLSAKILDSGIAESDSLIVKDYTRYPIIKFIDRESKIHVDLPFHKVKVAPPFDEYKRKHPVLWKLMFVLKQFIKQRGLNAAGEISSFALTLMCISFLQKHPTYNPNVEAKLGELLIDFFELYGEKFDYKHFGISIRNGGEYLPRTEMPCDGEQLFCVDDPVHPRSNACKLTYRGPDIKQAFREAYSALKTSIASGEDSTNKSVLGLIVYVAQDFIEYRKWVMETFEHTLKSDETGEPEIRTDPSNSINGESNIKSEL